MSLDPVVRELLESVVAMGSGPLPTEADIVRRRSEFGERSALGSREPRSDVEISDTNVGGVPVRLYRPSGEERALPLHLYFHGGGFMLGSAFSGAQDANLAERSFAARCVVASVEYRLAPEHRFPAGLEDCYTVLEMLVGSADDFGIDPDIVSVGGGSSGGNFAAVVALLAKERGGPQICLQLLEAAGTDLTKSSTAWRHPAEGHDTTREADLHHVDMYLSSVAQRADVHASPLFYPDLTGVAPAYIMNAEFDPRRDECEAYAVRLSDAGVPVTVRTMRGHIHSSSALPDWPPAIAWRTEANSALADAHKR